MVCNPGIREVRKSRTKCREVLTAFLGTFSQELRGWERRFYDIFTDKDRIIAYSLAVHTRMRIRSRFFSRVLNMKGINDA